jgi:hypothetical protein
MTSVMATRRDVLRLSAVALAAGCLSGCRMGAGTPPLPIAVPWTMKSLGSAETNVERLADGRLRFSVRHEVLAGVTPAMLVWWFNNMDGTLRIGDVDVPRYRAWHPRDHVALTYLQPGLDGRKFSAGARIRIQEFFGADPRYRVDVVDDVGFLDETGFNHSFSVAGRRVASMDYTFVPVTGGTRYENSLTVGIDGPAWLRRFVNDALRPWLFPESMGRAWLKHNVEEVGNFQFFLPGLYAKDTRPRARAGVSSGAVIPVTPGAREP